MSVIHKVVLWRYDGMATTFLFIDKKNADYCKQDLETRKANYGMVDLFTVDTDDAFWEHAQALKQTTP